MPNLDLTDLGLSPDLSQIYLSLLENGPQTASKLAQNTSVKRTYVYRLCQELEKLNLVSFQTQGKVTTFSPTSPNLLQTRLEAKQAQLNSAKAVLDNLLPGLEAKYRLLDTKPVVTYYEGLEGVKKVYDQICRDKNDILLLRSVFDRKNPELLDTINSAIRSQVQLDIHTQTITPLVSTTKKTYLRLDKKRLVNRHITKNPAFLLSSQIIVFGDKVAITSFKGKITNTIIDNKDITQTFRQIFYLLWDLTEAEHRSIVSDW